VQIASRTAVRDEGAAVTTVVEQQAAYVKPSAMAGFVATASTLRAAIPMPIIFSKLRQPASAPSE